jgi:putative flippase GtrA
MTRARLAELFRFGITGAASVALNVLIVVVLTEYVHLPYIVSIGTCFFTVTVFSFVLNRYWTFRKREPGSSSDLARYVCVTLINMTACLSLCALAVEKLHIQYAVAMVLLSVLFVPINFVLHRRWSFGIRWIERRT